MTTGLLQNCVLVILTTVQIFCPSVFIVTACKCAIKHPQQSFCEADFVMEATINNVSLHYATKETATQEYPEGSLLRLSYFATVDRWYRHGYGDSPLKHEVNIYTPGSLSDCRVTLNQNRKYVLTGHIQNMEFWVDICGWVEDIARMTLHQGIGLRKTFQRNCRCQVNSCSGSQCMRSFVNECPMDMGIFTCYTRFATCTYVRNRGCTWSRNVNIKRCCKGNMVKRLLAKPYFGSKIKHSSEISDKRNVHNRLKKIL